MGIYCGTDKYDIEYYVNKCMDLYPQYWYIASEKTWYSESQHQYNNDQNFRNKFNNDVTEMLTETEIIVEDIYKVFQQRKTCTDVNIIQKLYDTTDDYNKASFSHVRSKVFDMNSKIVKQFSMFLHQLFVDKKTRKQFLYLVASCIKNKTPMIICHTTAGNGVKVLFKILRMLFDAKIKTIDNCKYDKFHKRNYRIPIWIECSHKLSKEHKIPNINILKCNILYISTEMKQINNPNLVVNCKKYAEILYWKLCNFSLQKSQLHDSIKLPEVYSNKCIMKTISKYQNDVAKFMLLKHLLKQMHIVSDIINIITQLYFNILKIKALKYKVINTKRIQHNYIHTTGVQTRMIAFEK